MQLLATSARYFDDSRTGGPDGASPSDDDGSVADQFVTTTPDGRISRVDDHFAASLGGRAAIRNSMVRVTCTRAARAERRSQRRILLMRDCVR